MHAISNIISVGVLDIASPNVSTINTTGFTIYTGRHKIKTKLLIVTIYENLLITIFSHNHIRGGLEQSHNREPFQSNTTTRCRYSLVKIQLVLFHRRLLIFR